MANTNLFACGASPEREARIYVDESKSDRWLYLGLVLVMEEEVRALHEALTSDRHEVGYDRELHFNKITRKAKRDLACRWLQRAMYPDSPVIRWHVLGLDRRELRHSVMRHHDAIHARFLRTAIAYAAKALLPCSTIVTQLVHDDSSLASDPFFSWHTPWRLQQDHGLPRRVDTVSFVSSDHHCSSDPVGSTFVQLADVIVGATRVALDATTTKAHQLEVARAWLPIVERLCDESRRRNRNSRYGYLGRCSISFFPKPLINRFGDDDPESRFYVGRRPALCDIAHGEQLALDGI